jgi:hypothetical protein
MGLFVAGCFIFAKATMNKVVAGYFVGRSLGEGLLDAGYWLGFNSTPKTQNPKPKTQHSLTNIPDLTHSFGIQDGNFLS